jgi:acetate---CoA ligase (ADP-forming)
MDAISKLFRPRSVAVIGASADPEKLTGRPIAYLQKHGFSGSIYPVNPRYQSVSGLTCYRDIAALPAAPDVALVLIAAERVAEAVGELADVGCGAAIVLASGFAETGVEGERRQYALKEAAGTMRLLGPNTIGLVNLTDKIMLSPSGAMELEEFPAGNIALVSQSGGILGSLLSRAAARGIGLSKLVATGNEADLNVTDVTEYLLDDDATAVVALYLESLRDPARFRGVAERARQIGKPIVVFKVGRSESGARAAASHTGALAGADRIYDAFFQQTGIIRAETFASLLDIPAQLSGRRKLRGRRVAIVTSTGGAATLVADSVGMAGFDFPPPDEPTARRLRSVDVRDATLDRNPIDVTLAGLRPEIIATVIQNLFDSATYDAVIVVVGSSALHEPHLVARPLIEAAEKTEKPLLAYVSPEAPHIIRHLNQSGVPAYAAPESCAVVLQAMLKISGSNTRTTGGVLTSPRARGEVGASSAPGEEDYRYTVPEDLSYRSGPLNEAESKRLFARYGIAAVKEYVARDPREATEAATRLGGNVALKILSRHVLHKTDMGGVAFNVNPVDVASRCAEMAAKVSEASKAELEGFLVQEMVTGGLEMILGCRRDPQFGPAILLGMGGITAELLNDTVIRLAPISPRDAITMIAELKAADLLRGFRNAPPADIPALADAIVAFSRMVMTIGERLVEAEINPLFVLARDQGVRAADGLVVLA